MKYLGFNQIENLDLPKIFILESILSHPNCTLQTLNLSKNFEAITYGVFTLMMALHQNSSLQRLDLDGIVTTKETFWSIERCLKNNQGLKYIHIEGANKQGINAEKIESMMSKACSENKKGQFQKLVWNKECTYKWYH
ncbi:hypothetical protein FGO68_gene12800 [Halteria grandinella]|uniref:Uncharacterized protein n=1 Tax=Halteria grandinella TaxID=5974 RepID=A0A8J8P013_HALGN|nr:hypothetical protein FGO68_gene12800 [Halteria grandinella]